MDPFSHPDIFATKGIEYLLLIGYLMLLVPCWLLLSRRRPQKGTVQPQVGISTGRAGWFRLPAELSFHPGHAWARAEGDGVYAVGLDEFAEKLLGTPDRIDLPQIGTMLEQGGRGWGLGVDRHSLAMLAPVRGEVVAVNDEVLDRPALVTQDPYGIGWLMKVRVPDSGVQQRNLLSGDLAAAWIEQQVDSLRQQMSGEVGAVLQDGGVPVSGMARSLAPDRWAEVVAKFLITDKL